MEPIIHLIKVVAVLMGIGVAGIVILIGIAAWVGYRVSDACQKLDLE